MPAQVFGADAVVTSMNLALFGSSYSLSEAAYDSQVSDASSNATHYAITKAFLEAGGRILACGSCLKLRNSTGSELCPLSTMKDLHGMVREADRVLTF